MTVKHRGMIAEQAANNHVMIFDENGNFAMHCTFDRAISENELKSTIDNYFNLKNKVEETHPPKRNWKDAFMNTFLGRN